MTAPAPRPTLSDVTWRPPLIETERLVLRGYEPGDAPSILRYASDPEVTPFMAWDPCRNLDDVNGFLNGAIAPHYEAYELDYALALRTAPDAAIGGLGACWDSRAHRVIHLGYILAKEHWGKGYMPEAVRALVRRAFETTDVQRIFAPIFAENVKSRRAAEKAGLSFEGVLRSNVEHQGRRWDQAIYAVVR
jgi:ribosomal-protein-alanine N-acetyltransferase